MATFVFPTTAELRTIEQVLMPRLTADDPIFEHFPLETVDDFILAWEQLDDYVGLQQVRGLDGAFPRVNKVGAKRYMIEPGVYGEFQDLNETELMRRRTLGTWDRPVNVDDMVRGAQDNLLQRRLDRIRFILWTLAATGTFSVAGPSGAVLATDTYTLQTASAAVVWATVATATPMADFRTVQLLGPSKGTNFGAGARAYMNRATYNKMISNTNANDLGGRRLAGLVPANTREDINRLLSGDDLAEVVIYDTGYKTDAGTFTRFLANDKVVFIGTRPGRGNRLGAYRMVRNLNNPGMSPGPYTEVIQQRDPPKRVNVFDAHNGGPIIEFPGSVAVLTVA